MFYINFIIIQKTIFVLGAKWKKELKDVKLSKKESNKDYWRAVRAGLYIISEEEDAINSSLNKLNSKKLKKEEEANDNINQEKIIQKNIFNIKNKWKKLKRKFIIEK